MDLEMLTRRYQTACGFRLNKNETCNNQWNELVKLVALDADHPDHSPKFKLVELIITWSGYLSRKKECTCLS